MKTRLMLMAVLAAFLIAPAIACDQTITCSIDGSMMVKVSEDYANGHVIGTYEHKTLAGTTHRATKACN